MEIFTAQKGHIRSKEKITKKDLMKEKIQGKIITCVDTPIFKILSPALRIYVLILRSFNLIHSQLKINAELFFKGIHITFRGRSI